MLSLKRINPETALSIFYWTMLIILILSNLK